MNKIKRAKLVIFDLDGTAADTMEGIVEALNRTMDECGYPTHTRESVLKFVNYHTRRYIEEALPEEARTDAEIDRVLGIYTRHYEDTYTLTVPFEGIPELFDQLNARCLVAMNSNKQDAFVKALAEQLFAPDTFIAAEGYRPDRPSKPDPAMAYAIMEIASEKLGESLTPDQCVYVGDSDVDFHTAVNAGMHPVSVSWGYRSHEFLKSLGDQPVAATMDELWDFLLALGA
ncbi:MAG: HAD family hydrolase [Clostridia bacterium]|nr:HAD family hydrolase [Clostridia bacterium]